ncbi:hypothetical protein GJ744_009421 [Endocarpon pusillum]|uniref:Uncharacterized protein n=1 Tax=Endocarpon pusillum TaxID=364733 RepID=A0A8H7AJJ7_9EURO|nr:hypothetical protein GJ744_009421 [Endocarpon pusillum]
MATETTTSQPPVPFLKLKEIAHEACDTVLASVTAYNHSSAESWNSEIIVSLLLPQLSARFSGPSVRFQNSPKPFQIQIIDQKLSIERNKSKLNPRAVLRTDAPPPAVCPK